MTGIRGSSRLRRAAYRILSGLAIIWLAVFYPAVCEIHGMMLFHSTETPNADLARSNLHDFGVMTAQVAAAHLAVQPAFPPGGKNGDVLAAIRFRSVPIGSTVMAMVALALPPAMLLRVPGPAMRCIAAAIRTGHQNSLAPPDQPPRRSI
jgi:hypothetical protein